MAAQAIRVPFQYFTDQDGDPLDNGSIYIGVANQNPVANPVAVYWDMALTSAASQPINTNAGMPTYQGTPANVYIDEYSYSITVKDSTGRVVYTDLAVINENLSSVTLAELPDVPPSAGAVVFLTDTGRQGQFICKVGVAPSDPLEGIYVASNTLGFYWERVWDGINGYPEWFGAIPNDSSTTSVNDAAIAACIAIAPWTCFGANDYWIGSTIKLAVSHAKIRGVGQYYNDTLQDVTRILLNSASDTILQIGPDTQPGSINSFPQGIVVENIYFGRPVVPQIASNCVGVLMRWVLNAQQINVKTDGNMIGFKEQGTVHCFKTNCEAVRAVAGSGVGTDYFIGHYAYGGGSIGAAGGNASLYNVDCAAGCNYGPLQTASGSIGFKADQGFTDVWYWNPETVNFYIGQAVFGNDSGSLVFSNTDFLIDHPIHDQFHYTGIYITDVASSGSLEVVHPYYGPASDSRAAYWVNSSNGAVTSRGGQWVMGGAPNSQPILLSSSQGCNIIGYPVILEAGSNYAIVGAGDVTDCRLEVFAKNPNTSAGALVQLSGTCTNVYALPQCSGKAAAFQYGIQVLGTPLRCTFNVSGLNSDALQAVNRKLDLGGPVTTAGYISGSTTNLAEGNFN